MRHRFHLADTGYRSQNDHEDFGDGEEAEAQTIELYTRRVLQLSVIIFRNIERKILLQFRDSGAPSEALGWSFFGGIAEGNETPLEAIVREVKEELDMAIVPSDVHLLAKEHWISPNSGKEKIVHLYEGTASLDWSHSRVLEGAGAAFLTKDEVASMENVSLLAKTFIAKYC